jgi:arylsulfatase A-like enzyme
MCTLVDDCVRKIIDSLERRGILEDTIVVFTSDHGDQMGEHGMLGKFYNTYEGSLKVPFVLRIPGTGVPGAAGNVTVGETAGETTDEKPGGGLVGRAFDQLVEMVDMYPTLCDLAGVPYPEPPWEPAGMSLVPLVDGRTNEHKSYVFSMIEHAHMVRTRRWKLVQFDNDRSELYDLENDPQERHNLYGLPEHRDVQLELATAIIKHLTTYRPANHHPGKNTFFG